MPDRGPRRIALAMLTVLALSMLMLAVPSPPVAAPSTSCSNDNVSSGYAATSSSHGVSVPTGTPVTVDACTTNSKITNVLFIWHRPDSSIAYTDHVTAHVTVTDGAGKSALQFSDTRTPIVLGDWGVQTVF